jgi:hypothetical protein
MEMNTGGANILHPGGKLMLGSKRMDTPMDSKCFATTATSSKRLRNGNLGIAHKRMVNNMQERKIICRTKEIFFGVTAFGIGEIRTKELEHAVEDLIEGWAKRHDYGTCCFDAIVRDISVQTDKDVLADIAKKDQEEADTVAS